jgi:HEAT repeat protein
MREHALKKFAILVVAFWSAAGLGAAPANSTNPAVAGTTLAANAGQSAVGGDELAQALNRLQQFETPAAGGTLRIIETAVVKANPDSALRNDLEQRFIATLQAITNKAGQRYLCKQLSLIASERSVPALGPLLDDPETAHMARVVLERIPGSAPGQLLLEKLSSAPASTKAGIINSLGILRVSQATDSLAALLKDGNVEIAGAAAMALGNIGDAKAAQALMQFQRDSSAVSRRVEDGLLRAAEQLSDGSNKALALTVYQNLFAQTQRPYIRLAGLKGQLLLDPDQAQSRLLDALNSQKSEDQVSIAQMAAELPASVDCAGIAEALPKFPPETQVALINVLADRKAVRTKSAIVKIAQESSELKVRRAALEALGALGDAGDIPFLAQAASTGDKQLRTAARASLMSLPGRDVDSVLMSSLGKAGPEMRVELIQVLSARGATQAAASLRSYLGDREPTVRSAAAKGLRFLGDERDLPFMITRLKSADSAEEMADLERGLHSICARKAQACMPVILAAMADSQGSSRIVLLRLFSLFGGAEALNVVRNELKSSDTNVMEAALQTLAAWPDLQALPDLLQIAKSSTGLHYRLVAFDGYVQLLQTIPQPDPDKVKALNVAMDAAPRAEDKKEVLSALADAKGIEAFQLAQQCLSDTNLVNEAAIAVINISPSLDNQQRPLAIATLKQLPQMTDNQFILQRAQNALVKLESNK